MSDKMYLIFENGTVFEGKSFGADFNVIGEFVFTTSMCGYADTLSDKCYNGQIVMQTFPLIGNYGISGEEFNRKSFVKGYVVREWCEKPSNFRCEYTINDYLSKNGITGIYGIDTRAVTKFIRENGTMKAMLSKEIPKDFTIIKNYTQNNLLETVSSESKLCVADKELYKVTLIDYGTKSDVIKYLNSHNCTVTTVPYNADKDEILKTNPDGIILSEGPGNPNEYVHQISIIKSIIGKKPILGLGLGHQLLALSLGGKVDKLPYGHRGSSQPVKEVNGIRTYITEQNHGYTVIANSLKDAELSFVNANDGSCEGVNYPQKNALSVQFLINTSSGAHDTSFIYDRFISLMEGK
ncbi:MAG: carbamoyl phosphate synthase small subunit [Clostridia bacterium]|nr:carbamoyl phosphate synthase small subunit [Clostridia bacterium]